MPSQNSPPNRRPNRASAVAIHAAAAEQRPRVVATGKGAVAAQILELAFAHGVKVRQDADLVEILEAIEVDCEIPVPALAVIAEILTYVYRENGALGATLAPFDETAEQL